MHKVQVFYYGNFWILCNANSRCIPFWPKEEAEERTFIKVREPPSPSAPQPPLTRHNLFRRSESTFSLSLWILITLYAEERERATHQEVTRPFVQIYGKGCRICSWSKPHLYSHTANYGSSRRKWLHLFF